MVCEWKSSFHTSFLPGKKNGSRKAAKVRDGWEPLFRVIVLERAVTGNHRRDHALAGHDVLADGDIDVDDHEDQDPPHAQVMPGMHVLALAEERDHPAEQHIRPASALRALAIERKAGEDHEGRAERDEEIH